MKRGRPPKLARDRQSKMLNLRLTPADYRALEEAAAGKGMSLSDYLRDKLGLKGEK